MTELDAFKALQLGKIVMDEPWDTALMWSDAEGDLETLGAREREASLQRVIIELNDEGLAFFYPIDDFAPGYDDIPAASAVLRREELLKAIGSERTSPVPQLAIRPTPLGRERHFATHPEDRARWERSAPLA